MSQSSSSEPVWKPRKLERLPNNRDELISLLMPATSPLPLEPEDLCQQPLHRRSLQSSSHHQKSQAVSVKERKIVAKKKPAKLEVPPKPVITAPAIAKPKKQNNKLEAPAPRKQLPVPAPVGGSVRIYGLGDVYDGRRCIMNAIGIDIGTKNVVMAFRDKEGAATFLQEINGYYIYPRPTKFVENMLDDPKKVRSDGTKRPAKWVKFDDREGIYVLGKDAEELAYAHNDTLLRPMAEGGISQDEDAMMILASIVQGLLQMAEKDVGKFGSKVKICYSTTADAINKSSNIPYHKQVIDLIIEGYDTKATFETQSIKESHAIVLKESDDGTGIGISWGAGTVTVSYVKWGDEIYSFCWVGAGDWIDLEVAKRHGYDPEQPRRRSRETPTTVCRSKEKIDLSDDSFDSRLELDISLHYNILIQNVIEGIVQGFIDNEDRARIDDAINIYMAGGTASPPGFSDLVHGLFVEEKPPFAIAKVKTCKRPLLAVVEGCLRAAELQ